MCCLSYHGQATGKPASKLLVLSSLPRYVSSVGLATACPRSTVAEKYKHPTLGDFSPMPHISLLCRTFAPRFSPTLPMFSSLLGFLFYAGGFLTTIHISLLYAGGFFSYANQISLLQGRIQHFGKGGGAVDRVAVVRGPSPARHAPRNILNI